MKTKVKAWYWRGLLPQVFLERPIAGNDKLLVPLYDLEPLKLMLEDYRNEKRGLPLYNELMELFNENN